MHDPSGKVWFKNLKFTSGSEREEAEGSADYPDITQYERIKMVREMVASGCRLEDLYSAFGKPFVNKLKHTGVISLKPDGTLWYS